MSHKFLKVYHFGAKVNGNGDMSALCFKRPRAMNLRMVSWTSRPAAVTCPKCLKMMRQQERA